MKQKSYSKLLHDAGFNEFHPRYSKRFVPQIRPTWHNVRGKYPFMFGQHPVPGDVIATQSYADGTNVTFAENLIFFQPLFIPYPIHINALGVRVAVGDAGASAIIGLYPSRRGIIGTLIDSVTVDISSVGLAETATAIYISEGLFWVAIGINNTTVELNDTQFNYISAVPQRDPELVLAPEYYTVAFTFGDGLPSKPSGYIPANGRVPFIYARIGT